MMIGAAIWMLTIAAAEPLGKSRWVTVNDYPMAALKEGRGGTTLFAVDVAASGKPTHCAIVQTSGWQDLDEASCRLVMEHARFNPALDDAGKAAATVYRDKTTWWAGTGDRPQVRSMPPAVTVKVANIPMTIGDPAEITVGLAVDAAGRTLSCAASTDAPQIRAKTKAAREEQARIEALVAIACKEASALRLSPFHDEAGQTAPSVQTVTVGFTLTQ